MKDTLMNFALASLLAALPLAASAQIPGEDRSCQQVEDMLAAGKSPAEVVTAMVNTNMALTGATVFAMECAGEADRAAIAAAGVGLATTTDEAKGVVRAVVHAAGESSAEAKAARDALKSEKKQPKPPKGYKTDYTPHGGGDDVSPST